MSSTHTTDQTTDRTTGSPVTEPDAGDAEPTRDASEGGGGRTSAEAPRTNPVFELIDRRVKVVTALVMIAAIALAAAGIAKIATTENPEEADFNPSGEIFDAQDRAEATFDLDEPILGAQFIVESADGVGGDVLTRDGLAEFLANADELQSDPDAAAHLATVFDNDLGVEIPGVYSIAHAVDDAIPGGLASADDVDVKLALATVLADGSDNAGLRATLSQRATDVAGTVGGVDTTVWTSPAFIAEVRMERDSFDIDHPDSDDADLVEYEYTIESETWLRDAQGVLQGDETDITVLGLAIDSLLTDEEEGLAAAPFILFAIVLIVFLVGALLRSYWASAMVVAGLGFTFLAYLGLWSLFGIAKSLFVTLIVPITVLAFGVDFFVHGFGRCREEQASGRAPAHVYPVGMTLVAGAVLLALLTSALAFVSNVVSGIPAIAEFGISAAIGLTVAYLVLGNLAPKLVLAVEGGVGPNPQRGNLRLGTRFGFLLMALVGGAVVMMCVVQPPIGAAALLVIFIPLFIVVPFRLTRRRNRLAAERGSAVDLTIPTGGRGVRAAGAAVHFMARWRVVTVPLVVVAAVAGLLAATNVDEEFEISDFVSSETDLVQSLELLDDHFAANTGGEAYLLIEGDITDPATLAAIDDTVAQLDAEEAASATAYLARDFDGELVTAPHAATVVRATMTSATSVEAIEAEQGVTLVDADGDGYPDTSEQVEAAIAYARANGVVDDDGRMVLRPDEVVQVVNGSEPAATLVRVSVPTITDDEIIDAARHGLEAAGDGLETATGGAVTTVATGETITLQGRLDAITDAMVLAIPVAFLLCAVVAIIFMRSLKYALISLVPMLLVLGWLYGFMYLFDYSINPVTATIAAIAIGVGVDYAMHFTIRFREEFEGEPSRFPALRRAGEATGVALMVSAFTSMGGFIVLALTPMPVFAGFGVLMAVTILFSLTVALLVLPSLLLLVTPSRKGDTRRFLEDSITGGDGVYDPHARETAQREFAAH
jgi:predicted RND superfamily exporter protein